MNIRGLCVWGVGVIARELPSTKSCWADTTSVSKCLVGVWGGQQPPRKYYRNQEHRGLCVGGVCNNGKQRQSTKSSWVKPSLCLYDKHHSLAATWHMAHDTSKVHRKYTSANMSGGWPLGGAATTPGNITGKEHRGLGVCGVGWVGGNKGNKNANHTSWLGQCISVPI